MHLCLLLFFSTVVYAVTRIVEPDFEGVNFAKALFGQRLEKVFQESAVDSETSCQIQCLKHIRCFSHILGTRNEKGKFPCQLCDSDRFTSHENLTQDKKWLYRGMELFNRRRWKKYYLLFFFLATLLALKQTKCRVAVVFNDGYTESLPTMSDLIYYRDRNIGIPSFRILSTFYKIFFHSKYSDWVSISTVSYTHLTLPTKLEV